MKEIYAIVRKEKSFDVKNALNEAHIDYLTWNVKGRGKEGGLRYKGTKAGFTFMPKIMFWIWTEDKDCKKAVDLIIGSAHTGSYGDGKIFILPGGEL